MVKAVAATGLPFGTTKQRVPADVPQDLPWTEQGENPSRFDTNILCINLQTIQDVALELGAREFENHYSIAQWFWELEMVPKRWRRSFDLVDEVWVTSEWLAEVFRGYTDKPVRAMPMVVDAPPESSLGRSELGLPDGFMFFFMFDHNSATARKNPTGLIEAFTRAFAPGEGPVLVLKSINGEIRPEKMAEIQAYAQGRDDIVILDGWVSEEVKAGLFRTCDAYVSLHRSEGFGLTMAEAMMLGKPVIATRYSGNLAFMDDESALLVDYTETEVPPGTAGYPAGHSWADPDLDQAAAYMRRLADDPAFAKALGERGLKHGRQLFSVEHSSQAIKTRLAEIWSDPDYRRTPAPRASLPRRVAHRLLRRARAR